MLIGASAGGIEAISRLLAQLPVDLPASVCVVQHQSPGPAGRLVEIFGRSTSLPIAWAEHGQPIRPGHVYVAPPDHHLMVADSHLLVSSGPQENRLRPAIDPLFRSAAASRGSRVIAVLLSGLLDDGVAGL